MKVNSWYDTSIGINLLKIYDGTNWIEAGGLKRGDSAPQLQIQLQVTYGQIQIINNYIFLQDSVDPVGPLIQ